MQMKTLIISSIVAATALSSAAQDLTKEITIEKENVPQERKATRRDIMPVVSLSQVKLSPLYLSEGASSAAVPQWLTTLEPAKGETTIGNSPYRGYASVGYFPVAFTGISAGYRAMATDATTLDVYGQYSFNRYKRANLWNNDVAVRRSSLTLGASLRQKIGESTLGADIDWNLYNFNVPTTVDNGFNQRVNNVDAAVDWDSRAGNLFYNIGIKYGYFGFAHSQPGKYFPIVGGTELKPLRENLFLLDGGVALPADEYSRVGVDIALALAGYNANSIWESTFAGDMLRPLDGFTRGYFELTPYYSFKGDNVDMRLGVDVDFAINSGTTIHVAPDVLFSWRPSSVITLWGKATGGQEVNSLRPLFDMNPYMSPIWAAARNSKLKYAIDAGFGVGPFRGLTAKIFGGYAATGHWLMPSVEAHDVTGKIFYNGYDSMNLKGWHWGVSAAYDYKGIIGAEVSFEMAPSKYLRGYYAWRDRAKRVLTAKINCSPIDGLDVELSYLHRAGRATYNADRAVPVGLEVARYGLGEVNALNLNASYSITEQWSVFANINNLLAKDWQDSYGITTAPVNGLIGVGYKF